jgi:hypothetical protein
MIGPGPGALMPHVASVAYRNWPVNCFSRELSMGCIGFPIVNYLPGSSPCTSLSANSSIMFARVHQLSPASEGDEAREMAAVSDVGIGCSPRV